MITINLKVREFLTATTLPATEITARLIIAPLITEKISLEQGNDIQLISTLDTNDTSTSNEFITVPDRAQAVLTNPQTAQTNANGNVQFTFDVSNEFDQVAQDASTTLSNVNAYLEITLRVANYRNRNTYWERPLAKDEVLDEPIFVDFAKCMVGHTARKRVKLWFCLHGSKADTDKIICVLRPFAAPDDTVLAAQEVEIEDQANTGTVRFLDLDPDTAYRFEFRYQPPGQQKNPQQGTFLTGGQFSTRPNGKEVLRIAFSSCHKPTGDPKIDVMSRWKELRNLAKVQFDSLFLLGDQIYGDNIEKYWKNETWFRRYRNRYHQLWSYRSMREVFTTVPTYMMLDDHEVVDDYGVKDPKDLCKDSSEADCEERISAALDTYQLFQQAHNPGNRKQPPFNYSFRIGPAEIFVSDGRTKRSPDRKNTDHPVLGDEQFQQFQQWAASLEVQNAEVVIFTSTVPLALFSFSELKKLAAQVGGAALGFLISGGRPEGLLLGGLAGHLFGGKAVEVVEDQIKNDPDLEDQWVFRENQKDLVAVLDTLFDLANGINPVTGATNNKPKIVLALSGDSHLGMLHLLRSLRDRHQRNPYIYSMTGSPISYPPFSESTLKGILLATRVAHGLDNVAGEIHKVTLGKITSLGGKNKITQSLKDDNPWIFSLDDHESLKNQGRDLRQYTAELLDVISERNYGLINIRKVKEPLTTLYNVRLSIHGTKTTLRFKNNGFEVNLGAKKIKPEDIGTFKPKGTEDKKDDGPAQPLSGGI